MGLLQYTAALQGAVGSGPPLVQCRTTGCTGQWPSSNTQPHCSGQWGAVDLLEYTAKLQGAVGSVLWCGVVFKVIHLRASQNPP